MIGLNQMAAFVAAAECGSFSKAAESVSISQPAMSRCIQDIESVLGVTLFVRNRRGVLLSPTGQHILPLIKRLLRNCDEARTAVAQWRDDAVSSLSVVGSVSVMPVVLPALLCNLRMAFGTASMNVGQAFSAEVVQQVLTGRAVLGVCVELEGHPELRHTPVIEAQLGLLARADFKFPDPIKSLRDLDGMDLVRSGEKAVITQIMRGASVDFPAYFDAPVVVDTVQCAAELVAAAGVVTVATGVGASHLKAEGFRFLPLPNLLPAAQVDIVSRRDAIFDERLERLRDILRASIHGAPWHASVRRVGAGTDKALSAKFRNVGAPVTE